MDGTASQRCTSKFKIEVRICIPAIKYFSNEEDKLRINENEPNFDVVFSDKNYL